MKKYELSEISGRIYIGNTREIYSLYKNFVKKGIAMPIFTNYPKLSPYKMYGLFVCEYNSYTDNWLDMSEMQIVSSDTALKMIVGEV